jgi:hypothetical protein
LATGHCGAYEAVRTARFLERLYFNPN